MTSTNALPTAARKVILAKRAGTTCTFCGKDIAVGIDHAFLLAGEWLNACTTCAASHVAQVQALLPRVEAVAATLPPAGQQALALQAQHAEADIMAVLQGDVTRGEATVQALQGMLATAQAFAPATVDPLAEQVAALREVIGTLPQRDQDFARSLCEQYARKGSLSPKQAPYVASLLAKAQAPAAATTPAGEAPLGLHLLNGKVVKVYMTQNNRKAGKVLVGGSFVYEKGATAGLSEATLMTAEQAREYGRTTRHCCNCGEDIGTGDKFPTLQSLAQGYGPTCATRNGWPTMPLREAVTTLLAEGITHPLLASAAESLGMVAA